MYINGLFFRTHKATAQKISQCWQALRMHTFMAYSSGLTKPQHRNNAMLAGTYQDSTLTSSTTSASGMYKVQTGCPKDIFTCLLRYVNKKAKYLVVSQPSWCE
jgi:hypothetical protein